MGMRARVGVLACAAVLTLTPLNAHAGRVVVYLLDEQGALGRLANGTTFADVIAIGRNARAVVVQTPTEAQPPSVTVSLSTTTLGCVHFVAGASTQDACGELTLTTFGAMSSATIAGTLAGAGFTIAVDVTITASEPPVPYVASSADGEDGPELCNPPQVTCPYGIVGIARGGTTSGSITSSTLGKVNQIRPGAIYTELFGELDLYT